MERSCVVFSKPKLCRSWYKCSVAVPCPRLKLPTILQLSSFLCLTASQAAVILSPVAVAGLVGCLRWLGLRTSLALLEVVTWCAGGIAAGRQSKGDCFGCIRNCCKRLQHLQSALPECCRGQRPCHRVPASRSLEPNTRCSRRQYEAADATFFNCSHAANPCSSNFNLPFLLMSPTSSCVPSHACACACSTCFSSFLVVVVVHSVVVVAAAVLQ